MTALELHEQRRLDVCEERIRRGLATFVDVGKALTEIRDARLYRETHGTFDEYCRERWGFTDRRARQMIEAAEIGRILPVENAGQANELARVPEDDRAEVWAEVNERTVGQPTAAAIRDVRNERYPEPPRADPTPTPPSGPTPRAQDELPDPHAVGPVEGSAFPAPSTAVSEFVDSDPDLQRERYMLAFAKALGRSDDFMEFDPDKLGDLADPELAESLDNYLTRVRNFVDRFHRARPGLQVIQGGRK